MGSYCRYCRNKTGIVFNRKKNCYNCQIEICSKCASEGVEVSLCYDCYMTLRDLSFLGNLYYCPKCGVFGKIQSVKCDFCKSTLCISCIKDVSCIEDHKWCSYCDGPEVKEIDIPKVKWNENKHPQYGPHGNFSHYIYSYNLFWAMRTLKVCKLDSDKNLNNLIGKAFKGLDRNTPENLAVYEASYDNFITSINPELFPKIKNAYENSYFDWKHSIEDLLPVIKDEWNSEKAIVTICSSIEDKELKTYLSDSYCNDIGENRITEYDINTWETVIPYLSKEFLHEYPGFAALNVWVSSKYLTDLHNGLKTIKRIDLLTPFFNGMKDILTGLIEIDPNLCLEGLKNVRRDNTISANISNIMIPKIQEDIEKLHKIAKDKEKIKIESLIDQRGAIVGDYVNKKVGTQTEIRDSVVVGSKISGVGDSKISICPYCGKSLDFPESPKFCPYCAKRILK